MIEATAQGISSCTKARRNGERVVPAVRVGASAIPAQGKLERCIELRHSACFSSTHVHAAPRAVVTFVPERFVRAHFGAFEGLENHRLN